LDQDLEIARGQHAIHLDASPQREVERPAVLLAMLQIGGGDWPPADRAPRPRADELDAVLDGPRVQAGRLLIEQVAAARVETQGVAELPRDLEVDALVGEIHARGIAPQQ